MKRILIRFMQIVLVVIVLIVIGGLLYMQHSRFGATASGDRLVKMQSEPNYKDGAFDNLEFTPALAEGVTYSDMLKNFFLNKKSKERTHTTFASCSD